MVKKSSADRIRDQLSELMKLKDGWDGDGGLPPSKDTFYQAQMMLLMMEEVFDQDIMDSYWIVPFSGGVIIESFDPTVVYGTGSSVREPMSSFDTDIDELGRVSFWYSENFYYEDQKAYTDYEIEVNSEEHTYINEDVIPIWDEHARRFQNHMRGKIDASKR